MPINASSGVGRRPNQHRLPEAEHIHPRPQKAVERFLWRAYDRLVLVERGVEHHRNTSPVAEAFDEAMVARIGVAIDGLQPARPIDMRHGGNLAPPLLSDLEH